MTRRTGAAPARNGEASTREPLWYKDAVVYQLHVRAFKDSLDDGIGDFRGLVEKLDYLQDLGVTALWLLPFYPSPLRDDGYDTADFRGIHPAYGSMRDFQTFLREAHRRGLRVITELVLNHTSDEHPWFQRARRAPAGSRWRNFYVWSDAADRYREARIIFPDFENSNWSWDPTAQAHYWHRFYSHQPDLNYESPDVRRAMLRTVNFWLGMGVDGLRLDAVPYLYERDGTSCENLPETHAYLRALRAYIDERFDHRMLLAEANQWPEDAAAYFGAGDECQMAFHFPLMPRLFMAIRMEDRFPIIDILQQTPSIPDTAQWAVFLRNHDELTLEMVTDEERDYMYRVYAYEREARINLGIRRRLAPLLGNDRAKIELMNGLLLSLPGTPVLYYGDEIGMGDNVYLGDRNGVRTPMQWSSDRNAGFSQANPQKLYLPVIIDPEFHFETVNVEAQLGNADSLLWWMRRLIALRKRMRVFGRGSIEFLSPENHRVLSFLRRLDDEVVLVVANLSRFPQYVELDLSQFKGYVPQELFGQSMFPPVGELPYLLTLGPHGFYWLELTPPRPEVAAQVVDVEPPVLSVTGAWERVLTGRSKAQLEDAMLAFLTRRRWFAGKAQQTRSLAIRDVLPVAGRAERTLAAIAILDVEYVDSEPESYVLPLAVAEGDRAERILSYRPQAVVAKLARRSEQAVLFDGLFDPRFCDLLLDLVAGRRRRQGSAGLVAGRGTPVLREIVRSAEGPLEATVPDVEQSNTSVVFGGRVILKLFRRLEEGVNPDLEIGRALTEQGFAHAPAVAGSIEYERNRGEPETLAILHEVVPNEGDAWFYTLGELGRFYERVRVDVDDAELDDLSPPSGPALDLADLGLPKVARETSEGYLRSAELLGQRTAELHTALAAVRDSPAFAPEPFTPAHQRSVYQSMRNLTRRNLRQLRRALASLPEPERTRAEDVLAAEREILDRLHAVIERPLTGMRTRLHGDFHLGQVLFTGRDFVIIDFEGEPARPLTQRKLKRSPLQDVAGMLRSFDYAAYAAAFAEVGRGTLEPDSDAFRRVERWGRFWAAWVAASFLRSYLETASGSVHLPQRREDVSVLLDAFVLEKAIYELGYELGSRPDWVRIPIAGILNLLGRAS